MSDWLTDHPDIRAVRTAAVDLNGLTRGKRMPRALASKAFEAGVRMPLSVLNVDIKGEDIEASPLVFETGDRDGVLWPTERGFVAMPWLETPTALLPMWMSTDAGVPFEGDPRHALRRVLDRYAAKGLRPVVATELEFYLVDDSGKRLRPPASPRSGKRHTGGEVLSMRVLDAFDTFFTELYDGCEAMDIPAETAISESGAGQFEINLTHGDAMKAADDTWLFKLLVHGLARKHGFAASFMAKPYPDQAGSGMHAHFSILNASGHNIFNDRTDAGTPALKHAIAGCLAAMPGSTLIFAPHGTSYDRFVSGAHAPTGIGWAYENRTAAIRVPSGLPIARRIEHRAAGGDINAYLLLAAMLGAALIGLEDKLQAPEPITGNAYSQDLQQIPKTWEDAIETFERDPFIARIFAKALIRNYVLTKRQEAAFFGDLTSTERLRLYLDTV
ncbi:MAG: glutamine synthetase [Rhodobacteraceae bacterium]|nr:glutamine synthetase [Paracoccaceae bacterium]